MEFCRCLTLDSCFPNLFFGICDLLTCAILRLPELRMSGMILISTHSSRSLAGCRRLNPWRRTTRKVGMNEKMISHFQCHPKGLATPEVLRSRTSHQRFPSLEMVISLLQDGKETMPHKPQNTKKARRKSQHTNGDDEITQEDQELIQRYQEMSSELDRADVVPITDDADFKQWIKDWLPRVV